MPLHFSSPQEAQEYRRPCGKSAGSWNKEGKRNPKTIQSPPVPRHTAREGFGFLAGAVGLGGASEGQKLLFEGADKGLRQRRHVKIWRKNNRN